MVANLTVMLNIVLSLAKFILCLLTALRQICTEQVLCDKDRTPKKVYPLAFDVLPHRISPAYYAL
jgi:hypothetical protein